MTSHNEVLIPCLGPLAASSLGPNGYSEQSRSADLNFSFDPSLFRPSLPSLLVFPAPLPWIRDTESLSEDPRDHVRGEGRLASSPSPAQGHLADFLPLCYRNRR